MKQQLINYNDCQFIIEGNTLISYAGSRSNIVISDHISIIGPAAFKNNDCIRSLVLGDCVTEIKEDAFCNCKKLKHIFLSKSVKSIGQCAFTNIDSDCLVIFDGTVDEYNKILRGEPFTKVHCTDGLFSNYNIDIL